MQQSQVIATAGFLKLHDLHRHSPRLSANIESQPEGTGGTGLFGFLTYPGFSFDLWLASEFQDFDIATTGCFDEYSFGCLLKFFGRMKREELCGGVGFEFFAALSSEVRLHVDTVE